MNRPTRAAAPMLALMDEKRIFFLNCRDGVFNITEGCDEWFSVRLTREQLKALAKEMMDFADGLVDLSLDARTP